MTNPNYSGVTIQIANPAVNLTPMQRTHNCNNPCCCQHNNFTTPPNFANNYNNLDLLSNHALNNSQVYPQLNHYFQQDDINQHKMYTYPAEYYTHKFNQNENSIKNNKLSNIDTQSLNTNQSTISNDFLSRTNNVQDSNINKEQALNINSHLPNNIDYSLPKYDMEKPKYENQDFTKSTSIIKDINERQNELNAEKKNTKEKQIVALTDEYIKSLENYLNNPNQDIRLMASKEILTRLDEDKSRYDDAALNALLNKMLQDPSKLIRIASLSAFNAQLASGNDYTIHLLHTIQQNPSADKEDVLQAADILLKLSAGKEIKHIPNPETKEKANGDK